jgi:hypothetical protein
LDESWGRDRLLENVHTAFRLATGDGRSMELELVSVSGVLETRWQFNYSIVFRGPLDRPVGQGTYRLEHEKLGPADVFIVPVARSEKGYEYEAVFNHLKKNLLGC